MATKKDIIESSMKTGETGETGTLSSVGPKQ